VKVLSIIRGKQDYIKLNETVGEKLTGIIYDPDESDDLMLVFDKHTINIDCDGVVTADDKTEHP
jgi:hypothetical protein